MTQFIKPHHVVRAQQITADAEAQLAALRAEALAEEFAEVINDQDEFAEAIEAMTGTALHSALMSALNEGRTSIVALLASAVVRTLVESNYD